MQICPNRKGNPIVNFSQLHFCNEQTYDKYLFPHIFSLFVLFSFIYLTSFLLWSPPPSLSLSLPTALYPTSPYSTSPLLLFPFTPPPLYSTPTLPLISPSPFHFLLHVAPHPLHLSHFSRLLCSFLLHLSFHHPTTPHTIILLSLPLLAPRPLTPPFMSQLSMSSPLLLPSPINLLPTPPAPSPAIFSPLGERHPWHHLHPWGHIITTILVSVSSISVHHHYLSSLSLWRLHLFPPHICKWEGTSHSLPSPSTCTFTLPFVRRRCYRKKTGHARVRPSTTDSSIITKVLGCKAGTYTVPSLVNFLIANNPRRDSLK